MNQTACPSGLAPGTCYQATGVAQARGRQRVQMQRPPQLCLRAWQARWGCCSSQQQSACQVERTVNSKPCIATGGSLVMTQLQVHCQGGSLVGMADCRALLQVHAQALSCSDVLGALQPGASVSCSLTRPWGSAMVHWESHRTSGTAASHSKRPYNRPAARLADTNDAISANPCRFKQRKLQVRGGANSSECFTWARGEVLTGATNGTTGYFDLVSCGLCV